MRDDPNHPEPQLPPDPLGQVDPRVGETTDTSWVEPDPPPIPDRIRKKVDPRRPSLPAIPKVPIKVDHRWLKLGLLSGGAVVVGLVLALLFRASSFDAQARSQWEDLCDDYARWFSPLDKSLDYQDKEILRDLGLGFVVDTLADASQYDPRVIADRPGSNLAALAQRPPTTARSNEGIKATNAAAAALRRVEVAFAKWPTTVALEAHHVMLIDHGWDRVAELVENTLKQAPPYGKAPVGPTLIAMQRLEAQTAGIAVAIERLEEELAVLEPFNDPVFEALAQAVDDLDHQAPTAHHPQLDANDPYAARLLGLAEALGPLEAFAHRFSQTVQSDRWPKVDHAHFRETGQAYAMLAQGDHAHDKIFRTWLDEADGFREAEDDWRPGWADAQRQALLPATASLRTLSAADHLTAKPLATRIDKLHARIDLVVNTTLSSGMINEIDIQRNFIERDVRDLVTTAMRFEQDVSAQQIAQTLREASPLTDDAAQQSPAAEAAWRLQRERLAVRLERDADLDAAGRDFDTARQELLALIDPDAPLGLPTANAFDLYQYPPAVAALLSALQDRAADQREATLDLALHEGLPVDPIRWTKLRNNYVQRLADADALADLAVRIDRAIAGAYPLDDPAVSSAEGGVVAEIASWSSASLMNDPTVAAAARPTFDRVKPLQQLAQNDRWETLSAVATQQPDAAVAFAAWRRMGAIDWPGDARALANESAAQDHLARLAESIAKRDPARAAALKAELIAARPVRWQRAMRAAGSDADLRKVVTQAEAMNVSINDLPAATRFNVLLHRVQSAVASLPTTPGPRRDAEVLAIAQAFAAQVRPMADHPQVAALLRSLDAFTTSGAQTRELLTEAGPARRGWAAQPHDDGQAITFTHQGWALTFVRIDPERGPPFYLCTTELPVGLALNAAAWDDADDELRAVMPPLGEGDTRKGPRVWTHGESSLTLNPQNWLDDSPGYLADLTPSPPSPQHPINYVSAEGASYLAALLGCRLPTVDQWITATKRYPVPPRVLPNLRDTTWARHAAHAARLIQAGNPGIDWANSDTFRPAVSGENQPRISDDPVGDFHPINDTTLWFTASPTHNDATASPVNLVGNVAELVTLGPVDPDVLLDDARPIAERRDAFRRQHKQAFAVVGASALSPASLNPTAPQPFNVFSGARGYADVGLRLAFDVPFVSPARQAASALRTQAFLRP